LRAALESVIAGTLTPRARELNKKPQTKWQRVNAPQGGIKSLNDHGHAFVGVKMLRMPANKPGYNRGKSTILKLISTAHKKFEEIMYQAEINFL
jgi:hypothetical protein